MKGTAAVKATDLRTPVLNAKLPDSVLHPTDRLKVHMK